MPPASNAPDGLRQMGGTMSARHWPAAAAWTTYATGTANTKPTSPSASWRPPPSARSAAPRRAGPATSRCWSSCTTASSPLSPACSIALVTASFTAVTNPSARSGESPACGASRCTRPRSFARFSAVTAASSRIRGRRPGCPLHCWPCRSRTPGPRTTFCRRRSWHGDVQGPWPGSTRYWASARVPCGCKRRRPTGPLLWPGTAWRARRRCWKNPAAPSKAATHATGSTQYKL